MNIAVEIIGIIITQILENNKRKADARAMADDDSANKPLIDRYDRLDALSDDVRVDPTSAAK